MATRESQGLQIALILFVMVSVVLAVTTFVFYSSSEKAKRVEADAKQKQKTSADQYQTENFKVQYLKHILGAATLSDVEYTTVQSSVIADADMKAVDDRYTQDMDMYEMTDPAQRNYQALPQHMVLALRNKNVGYSGLTNDVNRLTDQKSKLEQAEQQRTQTAQSELQKARDDAADERTKFADYRGQMKQAQDDMTTSFGNVRKKLNADLADERKRGAQRQADITSLENTVSVQETRILDLIDQPFEVADGRVTWVSQSAKTVWINLGMADGLRRQTTFSVYDIEAMNVAPSRNPDDEDEEEEGRAARMADSAKGKLEITRVIDQHLAEARIVDDDPADPILPGDQVYSPAWKPGRRIRFALVGFMDINDDKRSDRDLVRNIITAGGGVIDCEMHDDGQIVGKLTAQTRYLVRGAPPTNLVGNVRANYSAMHENAKKLGIQRIGVLELLDMMGYKAEVRTVELGDGPGPLESRLKNAEKEEGDDAFRERRPPSGNGDSAY